MNMTWVDHVAALSDSALLARVARLAQHERRLTATLIAHLAELDARRLYLTEGCSSLFAYCTQVLHLSEHAAYGRIEAARAARRFPVLLVHLADGAVNLTTVCLLAPHLTAENHSELLERARHQSKRAVEELVAGLCPRPPAPDVIRKVPAPAAGMSEAPLLLSESQAAVDAPQSVPGSPTADPPTAARRTTMIPLAPDRYKIQFTATAALHAKLRQAQALLRHQVPDGNLEQILDRALTALLREVTKQKVAATERPRESSGTHPRSRHIPAEVKRTVWIRDGGRCAFLTQDGRRCAEEGFLEFHHVRPYAAGGPATIDNIQLRCRAHNAYEAEQDFGRRLLLAVREDGPPYEMAFDSNTVRIALTCDRERGPARVASGLRPPAASGHPSRPP
jgi:hypothetical protein